MVEIQFGKRVNKEQIFTIKRLLQNLFKSNPTFSERIITLNERNKILNLDINSQGELATIINIILSEKIPRNQFEFIGTPNFEDVREAA